MSRLMLAAALLLLPAGTLAPGEKDKGPKGPPPQIQVVELDPDGRPVLVNHVTKFIPQVREYTVTVPTRVGDTVVNRVEKRQRTVMVPVTEIRKVALDAEGVRIVTAAGKRIEPRNLEAVLKRTTPVLVSRDGKAVDPFYLRLLRADALIVIAPELARPPVPPAPVPPKKD